MPSPNEGKKELDKKGLILSDINNYRFLLDPDNIFWAVPNAGVNGDVMISRELISLYENVKNRLDREVHEFRFSTDLGAIYINPTDRCNASCPYCYIPAKIRRYGRSMTSRELTFILEKIRENFSDTEKKPVIVFHASEPLLVKDIVFGAIRKYIGRFYFGLQTNAILLGREDVEFLKENRVGVGISLDSYLPSINNRLRPTTRLGGNLESALRAIEWFDGYEGLNVITTITKLNVTELPHMVKFLHKKKVPCVLLNPLRLTQRSSYALKPDERLMVRYFIRAIDTAIELSKHSEHRIVIGNFANIILGIVAPTARRLMCDISPCGGGRCFLTITASGEMIPCGEFIGLNGFSGGNIFKTEIKEAMESKAFKRIRGRTVEKIEECSSCIFRNICGASCPAELHALGNMYPALSDRKMRRPIRKGGMYQPSVFCEFYKQIIKYAFELIAGGKGKYCLRKDGFDNLKYHYCLKGGREK